MAERYFCRAYLFGEGIQGAPPQPRTQAARRFALGYLLPHHRIGVFLDDVILDITGIEVVRQHVGREARLFLIHVDGNQFELDRRVVLQALQQVEHRAAVLAARQAGHDPIAGLDHAVVADGAAHVASQALLQFVEVGAALAVQRLHGQGFGWAVFAGSQASLSCCSRFANMVWSATGHSTGVRPSSFAVAEVSRPLNDGRLAGAPYSAARIGSTWGRRAIACARSAVAKISCANSKRLV